RRTPSWHVARVWSGGKPARSTPLPGQKLADPPSGVIRQAGEHVGEPSLRIDIVELGSGDQRVDRSGAPAAVVGAGEGPVLSPESDGRSSRSAALFDTQRRPSSRKRVKASQRLRL